jgi:DNA polymerase III epsilon subunit-like protein
MWLDRSPASVAFCDVETTGLGKDDRIVSFGGIGMITKEFAKGRSQLTYTYLVFDPGKRNHPGAQQVHGFSDWVLAAQEPFEVHAAQVWRFLTSYDLLVAHNAASRDDIGRTVHSHPADLLHPEGIQGAWARRQRCAERGLQPSQARSLRPTARSD